MKIHHVCHIFPQWKYTMTVIIITDFDADHLPWIESHAACRSIAFFCSVVIPYYCFYTCMSYKYAWSSYGRLEHWNAKRPCLRPCSFDDMFWPYMVLIRSLKKFAQKLASHHHPRHSWAFHRKLYRSMLEGNGTARVSVRQAALILANVPQTAPR